jgi:thioredoxin 1
MPVDATQTTFEQEVLESEGKVIVDFWAEWCGPCHAVAPVLERIADEHDVKIVKVDIDREQGLAQRYGVASIPMMVLFENGEPQASAVGAMPKGALERTLGLAEAE